MSELNEQCWSVVSSRGVEASGMSYDEALTLRHRLDAQKVYGLCIVSDEAAQREANQMAGKASRQSNRSTRGAR